MKNRLLIPEMAYPDAELQIYDARGRLLQTLPAENIRDQRVISTKDWNPGTYYVRLYINNKEVDVRKFTVVR